MKRIYPGLGHLKFRKYFLMTIYLTISINRSRKIGTVIDILFSWSNKSKKRLIEQQVSCAILNEKKLTHEIRNLKVNKGLT